MFKFPKNFLWGAATSAHQVEGNNKNDWTAWENNSRSREKSGFACDHYNLYEDDFDIAKSLNHNAHRLSIEWSRVEPEEGRWNKKEIEHYKNVLKALKKRGLRAIVSLHHFSNPAWLAARGGWEKGDNIACFLNYAQKMVDELDDLVDYWVTINEPVVYLLQSYVGSDWPPGKRNWWSAIKVFFNMASAHRKAYQLIHEKTGDKARVGLAHNIASFAALENLPIWAWIEMKIKKFLENDLIFLVTGQTHDFIGVNYYFHHRCVYDQEEKKLAYADAKKLGHEVSSMGWEVYPSGLETVLMELKRFNRPIIICENGMATNDDSQREKYITSHLQAVQKAINRGAPVAGYLHWSLLDNFEWSAGYKPRFGLVEVDKQTMTRKIKKSAKLYSKIIKNNGIIKQT